jgi:hypothetical protein
MNEPLTDRLTEVEAQIHEMREADVRPTPGERIRWIRRIAQIAQEADQLAKANYEATKRLTGEEWDLAFAEGDRCDGIFNRAVRILLDLLNGTEPAEKQMEAIERRCHAGGF